MGKVTNFVEIVEMKKICGRCQNSLECLASSTEQCSCFDVKIDSRTREYLSETSYDCLCNSCLTELNDMVVSNSIREQVLPADFVEGIHFYKENGYFVFTELYQYLKGKCCTNVCRHCAYGIKLKR